MNKSNAARALTAVVIDDNEAHLELIRNSLEIASENECPTTIRTFTEPTEAIAQLPPEGRVVVICDYLLAETSGIDWLSDFVRADVGPVIIVSSSGDERVASEAFRQGASDYIDKATVFEDPARLRIAINDALRRFTLEHTNRELTRKLKLANGELQRKNDTLAEITDTAHRFVDDVAHEFRTPLSVIKEFASIISDGIGGEVTERQREYLKFITDASRDLAHLIDDFLDSGKLRARVLRIDRREYTIEELIESSWQMFEIRASGKHVFLERTIDGNLPTVFADADKVRRSLINLVINAIKFSNPNEKIIVAASKCDESSVRVSVTDRGPGLPEEELNRLFQRFRQGGEANRISTKGFGLGLNIVKELVAINLGEVSVESMQGRGSTFSFTLPICDPTSIVDAFLHRMNERSPEVMISALSVFDESFVSDLEQVRLFTASACYATDVQLPAADNRSIIVIGATIQADQWRERLMRLYDEQRKHVPQGSAGRLCVKQIGSWPLATARDALLKAVCPVMEMKRCA